MKKLNDIAFVQITSAILIVNFHTGILDIPFVKNIAKFGFIFNTVFVFLSGFLLANSLSKELKFKEFFSRRFSRIYPSFHMALLVISLVYLYTGREFTFQSFFLTATGFAYYFGDETFGGHLWFVSVIITCYLICMPTYYCLVRQPVAFFMSILVITLAIAYVKEGSFVGIYSKVSGEPIYRFLYHYIVFSIALYMGSRNILTFNFKWAWGIFLGILFVAYFLVQPNRGLGLLALGIAILLAVSIINVFLIISSFVEKHFPSFFLLSLITYELYLIHYCVIETLDESHHGLYIAYPLTFLFSTILAIAVLMLSKAYKSMLQKIACRLCLIWNKTIN